MFIQLIYSDFSLQFQVALDGRPDALCES